MSGHYADFWQVAEDALAFAADSPRLPSSPDERARLMQAYLGMKAWPEVSSSPTRMLKAGIENAGMVGMFEHVLSTDQMRSYKPDPRAYQLATDELHLEREAVLFVPSVAWDAAGAKWFGYQPSGSTGSMSPRRNSE